MPSLADRAHRVAIFSAILLLTASAFAAGLGYGVVADFSALIAYLSLVLGITFAVVKFRSLDTG